MMGENMPIWMLLINAMIPISLAGLSIIAWFAARILKGIEQRMEHFDTSINQLNSQVAILVDHKKSDEREKELMWSRINDLTKQINRG